MGGDPQSRTSRPAEEGRVVEWVEEAVVTLPPWSDSKSALMRRESLSEERWEGRWEG